jgi:hypothetical protein
MSLFSITIIALGVFFIALIVIGQIAQNMQDHEK